MYVWRRYREPDQFITSRFMYTDLCIALLGKSGRCFRCHQPNGHLQYICQTRSCNAMQINSNAKCMVIGDEWTTHMYTHNEVFCDLVDSTVHTQWGTRRCFCSNPRSENNKYRTIYVHCCDGTWNDSTEFFALRPTRQNQRLHIPSRSNPRKYFPNRLNRIWIIATNIDAAFIKSNACAPEYAKCINDNSIICI